MSIDSHTLRGKKSLAQGVGLRPDLWSTKIGANNATNFSWWRTSGKPEGSLALRSQAAGAGKILQRSR
jgi:hypothetical protein